MIERGVGRRSWRSLYPSDEWATHKRQQLANGDRIVMVREKGSMRSAVLTFFHKDNDLHWALHYDGSTLGCEKTFQGLVEQAEPPADYSQVPNYARF